MENICFPQINCKIHNGLRSGQSTSWPSSWSYFLFHFFSSFYFSFPSSQSYVFCFNARLFFHDVFFFFLCSTYFVLLFLSFFIVQTFYYSSYHFVWKRSCCLSFTCPLDPIFFLIILFYFNSFIITFPFLQLPQGFFLHISASKIDCNLPTFRYFWIIYILNFLFFIMSINLIFVIPYDSFLFCKVMWSAAAVWKHQRSKNLRRVQLHLWMKVNNIK